MKNRWLACFVGLLLLVGCTNSISQIQTDIEIVEGENIADDAEIMSIFGLDVVILSLSFMRMIICWWKRLWAIMVILVII
ncbi:MAG: hypothetical protein SPH32_08815 [Erysipelotrichaceae bacterium]|nr:hypothetical protein [Erysipelotrichaceae bacterium]